MRISNGQAADFAEPKGFVVLEGVNGAGKGTLLNSLMRWLNEDEQISAVSTFEPGATSAGKSLRRILLENKEEPLHPETELFLFSADRREHVAKVICPALNERRFVISDRYYYSTSAFQGYGRGIDLNMVVNLNRLAIADMTPDLVILLDLDPLEGLRRSSRRNEAGLQRSDDSFEREELSFHERLRNGFLEMADSLPELFLVLDARESPQAVFERAKTVIKQLVQRWREWPSKS